MIGDAAGNQSPGPNGDAVLHTAAVSKTFQGLVAVNGVSLDVESGQIFGLIGPNGSGKTTFLNVISGVLRPSGGRISIGGHSAEGLPSHKIARLGVGRTFQQIRLFDTLSVFENVEVGAVAKGLGGQAPEITGDVLEQLGLVDAAALPAGTLPYGEQRRVEIARAVAGRPRLLLLDEPAAGMNDQESERLFHTLTAIRRDFSCAILIVDHDLRLITRVCERIHVLAEGETIAEGVPTEIQRDSRVIEAYNGSSQDGNGAGDQGESA